MEQKQNAGYTIQDSISYNNIRCVMGHNPDNETAPYVTWRQFGENDYTWGHYCKTELEAKRDLYTRMLDAMPELETEQTHDYRLEIVQDENPSNPRTEYDNFGTMVFWNKKYSLGEKHDFDTMYDFKDEINENNALIMPVYMYEHGDVAISTRSFVGRGIPHAAWDSGLLGYIYATFDQIQKEFGAVNDDTKKQAMALLNGEVEEYGNYLNGNVYGYKILDNDKEINSCYGFIGSKDEVTAAMRENAPEQYQYLFDEEQTESCEYEAVQ